MEFSRLLVLCLLVAVWAVLAAAATDVAVSPKPGCPKMTRCGNIEVPFPFALKQGCAITERFQLNCTKTAGGRKLLFHEDGHGNKLEVISINVTENKVRLKTPISRQCSNQSNEAKMNITGMPYVLSHNDNTVTILGCESSAYMSGHTYIFGCQTRCNGTFKNGSCSSEAGCCQVKFFPTNVRTTRVQFGDPLQNNSYATQNQIQIWKKYPCNYATVMESKTFNFSTTYLTSTAFYDARMPVVMEWGITRNNNCKAAQLNKEGPYGCVANNSQCNKTGAGYACTCSHGYKGNPYLVNGCRDKTNNSAVINGRLRRLELLHESS